MALGEPGALRAEAREALLPLVDVIASPTGVPLVPVPLAITCRSDDDLDKEGAMPAHSGERAQKTGDFHCATCGEKVHVTQGDKIPKCPNGHTESNARTREPDTKG